MPEAELVAPRPPYIRRERSRLQQILLLSLTAHALLVAAIVEARFLAARRTPESREPGFQIVFGNAPDSVQAVPPAAQQQASLPQVNLAPDEYVPPPPPVPSPEAVPLPPPRTAPRRARPKASANPFAGMTIYGAAPNPVRQPQIARAKGLNLDLDAASAGVSAEANQDISSPGADGDFLSELSDYVERHKYYPDLAVRNGESGQSIIKAVFNHDGTVKSVQLLQSSGSRTLDVAWMELFRHKKIAPFPESMPQATQPVILSMDFQLIRN